MKRLWAPWRMEYILDEKKHDGCLFCAIAQERKANDRKNLILYRGKRCFVVLNRYPYNNGHLMVVPFFHTPTFDGLDDDVLLELMKTQKLSVDVIRKAMSPDGFNLGLNFGKVAGAGMESHMHMHIVPRWNGDTDSMPIIAETRVMPEHLMKIYSSLKSIFRKEGARSSGKK